MNFAKATRDGEWLLMDVTSEAGEEAGKLATATAHEWRKWLLARSWFPEKWVNRLFSTGGIRGLAEQRPAQHGLQPSAGESPAARQASQPSAEQSLPAMPLPSAFTSVPLAALLPPQQSEAPLPQMPAAPTPQVPAAMPQQAESQPLVLALRMFPLEPLAGDPLYRLAQSSKPTGSQELDQRAEVLFEDDHCLVLSKPAGMPVHQSSPGQQGTLDEAVLRHLIATGQQARARHIHRLDDWTSGPVLYAKHELAQLRLDEAMRDKEIERTYIAIVQGMPLQASGTIDKPIGRDRHHSARRRVSPTGDRAVTHYEVVQRLRGAALVRLTLETGRTHQIRVHMGYIGHPLLGDSLYGGPAQHLSHQALHGEQLQFRHPLHGEWVTVHAPAPPWVDELVVKLSARQKS